MPISSPSTVLLGDSRGASGRRPYIRPPKYAPVSPMNVPTRTSTMIPPPWGSSRSSTAWASASPIHQTPNRVTAMPSVGASWRGWSSVSPNRTGTSATSASSTWNWSP